MVCCRAPCLQREKKHVLGILREKVPLSYYGFLFHILDHKLFAVFNITTELADIITER